MKKLFYNGNIITLTDGVCESVLIDDDTIVGVGSYQNLRIHAEECIDLHGKTLMPSFLDAHSHLSSFANSMLQVPLDETSSFEEIQDKLRGLKNTNNLSNTAWIIGSAFDDNNLKEQTSPNAKILDEVSQTNPIVIQHKNGHNGVFNTKAMEVLNIKSESGILEEDEYMKYIKLIPMPDFNELIDSYIKAQNEYLKYGITEIQEGLVVEQMIPIYQYLLNNDTLFLNTVVFPTVECFDKFKQTFPNSYKKYDQHMKIGGIKIILDGSPQSKTAWMLTPYKDSDNYGYGVMTDDEVYGAIKKALEEKVQIIAHCNGDAAINQYLTQLEKFDLQDIRTIRPVIIHAQLLNLNQLDRVKVLGVIPSFFVGHVFHFGDIHIKNFGMERASLISPLKSTLDKGITFTFHQDTPVIKPNMLESIWCGVNRLTKSNVSLGTDEKIDVLNCLKAVTINVACQYGEENCLGTIERGKKANFIVLDKNPLKVKPIDIKDIKILEVINNGKSIYKSIDEV